MNADGMSNNKFIDKAILKQHQKKVDEYSDIIEGMVERCLRPYCKGLDDYVSYITSLINENKDIPDIELEDIIIKLPQLIYWASEGVEQLGIKEDIAKSLKSDGFIRAYQDKQGSVSQKNLQASLEVIVEEYTQLIYSHAAKQIKIKITYATELLQCVKKIYSGRIAKSEWILTKEETTRNKSEKDKRKRF